MADLSFSSFCGLGWLVLIFLGTHRRLLQHIFGRSGLTLGLGFFFAFSLLAAISFAATVYNDDDNDSQNDGPDDDSNHDGVD